MASSSSSAAAPPPPLNLPSREAGDRGNRGGPSIILRQLGGYSAEILYYGAQVISWQNGRGDELLFLRSKAAFEPPHPFRGGIPICFPKFFHNANMEQRHGFARRKFWSYDFGANMNTDMPNPPHGHVYVDLLLYHYPIYNTNWPNRVEFRLRVILSPAGDLTMISRIKNVNTDRRPFTFPFSYQNYFSVSDISDIRIEGLERRDYVDYMRRRKRFNQGADAFTLNSAVDRLYLRTPNKITLTDNGNRTIIVQKSHNLPDLVVWNKWYTDEDGMGHDFNDLEDKEMVCVEAAAQEKEIRLFPGQEWRAIQRLSFVEHKRKFSSL